MNNFDSMDEVDDIIKFFRMKTDECEREITSLNLEISDYYHTLLMAIDLKSRIFNIRSNKISTSSEQVASDELVLNYLKDKKTALESYCLCDDCTKAKKEHH